MTSKRRMLAASLAAFVALGLGALLLVLRYGRPLYYSDGRAGHAGAELRQASMLEFGEPQVLTELPGDVVGRVAVLPDGRWIYGSRSADGDVDLVTLDPQRPGLPPEKLVALNSSGVDFAPAMGPGPVIYFSSDREGGEGGMDLYRSAWREGSFGPVQALRAGINTGADESDPAPAPAGPHAGSLVFVRQEPGQAHARLWQAALGAGGEPSDLFPEQDAPAWHALVRDPIWSADGRSLYFVRQGRRGIALLRTASHQGKFLQPWAPAGLSDSGAWRSPLPGPEGLALTLLRKGDPSLLYRSVAEERIVFWAGQRELERLLLIGLLTSALLVLLITLGGRWSQLDLITKLLLLSLLIHGLILLVMSRVDILMSEDPGQGDEGTIEVEILSHDAGAAAGNAALEFQPVKELVYQPKQADLAVEGPSSEIAKARMPKREVAESELPPVVAEAIEHSAKSETVNDEVEASSPQSVSEDLAGLSAPKQDMPEQANVVVRPSETATDTRQGVRLSVQVPGSAATAAPTVAGTGVGGRPSRGFAEPSLEKSVVPAGVAALAMSDAPESRQPRSVSLTGRGMQAAMPSAMQSAMRGRAAPLTEPMAGAGAAEASARVASEAGALTVQMPRTDALPGESASRRAQEARTSRRSRRAQGVPDPKVEALVSSGARPVPLEDGLARSERRSRSPTQAAAERGGGRMTGEVAAVAGPGEMDAVADATGSRASPATAGPGARLATIESPGSSLSRPTRGRRSRRANREITEGLQAGGASHAAVVAEADVDDSSSGGGGMPGDRNSEHAHRKPKPESASTLGAGPLAAFVQGDLPLTGAGLAPMSPRPERKREAGLGGLPSVPASSLARAPRRRHRSSGPKRPGEDLQPGVFRNRFGVARIEALKRFGGTQETEAAVVDGLAYLARVQKSDGSWGNKGKDDRKYGETFVGKTALCLLAFLGAGHVPGKRQKHSKVARKAMEFLLFVQDEETGHFGLTSAYSHGITTYALAECYALTHDERLRAPLLSAVIWILENQNASRDRNQDGGWGYYSPTLRREDAYARTSVSSWQVMALLSAQKAGLEIPNDALVRARRFFANSYDRRRGSFLYSREPGRLRSRWRTLPASTPASVFSLLLLGEKASSDRVKGGLAYTLARRPKGYVWRGDDAFVRKAEGNTYFWYYGSLACFLAGGETWKQWNRSLVDVLPGAQLEDGSFKPLGPYADYAGDDKRDRSYTTAMCVLSLEVYYRYFTPLLQGR